MTQHPTRFMTFSAADVGLPTQMESAVFNTIFQFCPTVPGPHHLQRSIRI